MDKRVIGTNGKALDLKKFVVLPVSLGTNIMWHEFGVVPNLPLEQLIGANIFALHLCFLDYLKDSNTRLQFEVSVCASCNRIRINSVVSYAVQLRFINRVLQRKRNKLEVGYNFLPT